MATTIPLAPEYSGPIALRSNPLTFPADAESQYTYLAGFSVDWNTTITAMNTAISETEGFSDSAETSKDLAETAAINAENSAAQAAADAGSANGNPLGDYANNIIFNSHNDYVSENGLFRLKDSVPTPYTTNTALYPLATDDDNLAPWSNVDVLKSIALALNVPREAVLNGVAGQEITAQAQYLYNPADQATWGLPAGVGASEVIVSVAGDQLETDVSSPSKHTMRKPAYFQSDEIGDGADDISDAIAINKSVHIIGEKSLENGITVSNYCVISGDAFNNSKLTATLTEDEAAFTITNGFNISGLDLNSVNLLDGIGVSSGNNKAAFNSYSDMEIGGFKYGIWHRKSLWNSYKNLNMGGNICGIRLARADYVSDNSNPLPPSGWNTGWFNNQLTFDNVLVDGSGGGEVGIWACGMGMTFNSVTCQDILTDGTSNRVLPGSQVGTGLIIDSGTDDSIDGWNNVVNNFYAENVGIGIHAKGQKYLNINGAFVQGKAGQTKHALLAERSIVKVDGMVGQDSFTGGVINAIDESTVYVNELIGPVVGSKFVSDATSIIYPRGESDKNKTDYLCNGTATLGETFTFPEVVPQQGFVTLRFMGLNDGYSERIGTAKLYNWNNSSDSIVIWDGGTPPPAVDVAVSAGGVITMVYNSSQVLQGRVQIEQEGGFGISSTGYTLTSV